MLATKYVVRVAMMSALLTSLKFALSFIPNVEAVTLLIFVFASVYGAAYTVPAVLIFCAVEIALYGMGSWVALYFVFWPLLAVLASVLLKTRKIYIAAMLAACSGVFFGVLSACSDTLFCVANLNDAQLASYWVAYYLRGLYFDAVHVVSNTALAVFLFKPLCAVAERTYPEKYRSAPRFGGRTQKDGGGL